FVAERGVDGLAESNPHIFDSVVLIHVQIAFSGDSKVEASMARDKIQHVIEKRNARGDLGLAVAIEIQAKINLRFLGVAPNGGSSRHKLFLGVAPEQAQKFLEFRFRADGDACEAGAEIMAAFTNQNVVAFEFLEKCRASLAKIGKQEIGGAGIDAHIALLEFPAKPCAQAFYVAYVPRDGLALFHGSNTRSKRRRVHRVRRHGAAHQRKGIAPANHSAEAKARHALRFRKRAGHEKMRIAAYPGNGAFR